MFCGIYGLAAKMLCPYYLKLGLTCSQRTAITGMSDEKSNGYGSLEIAPTESFSMCTSLNQGAAAEPWTCNIRSK